jgi:hypothetical protein
MAIRARIADGLVMIDRLPGWTTRKPHPGPAGDTIRDSGFGIPDSGFRIRDSGFGIQKFNIQMFKIL